MALTTQGKGAFRRLKDQRHEEHPGLPPLWYACRDARLRGDRATAELATALSSRYRLTAADATHLATAVGMGADRFITSNKRDFPPTIAELQVTYPDDLAGSI